MLEFTIDIPQNGGMHTKDLSDIWYWS